MKRMTGKAREHMLWAHSALLEAAEEVASIMNGGTGSYKVAEFQARQAAATIRGVESESLLAPDQK